MKTDDSSPTPVATRSDTALAILTLIVLLVGVAVVAYQLGETKGFTDASRHCIDLLKSVSA